MSHPMVPGRRGKADPKHVLTTKDMGPPPSNVDVEGNTSAEIFDADPFSFRNGIKTDEELVVLRRRKKGKPLESYHRKQNEVRSLFFRAIYP